MLPCCKFKEHEKIVCCENMVYATVICLLYSCYYYFRIWTDTKRLNVFQLLGVQFFLGFLADDIKRKRKKRQNLRLIRKEIKELYLLIRYYWYISDAIIWSLCWYHLLPDLMFKVFHRFLLKRMKEMYMNSSQGLARS